MASAFHDGKIELWDLNSRQRIFSLSGHSASIYTMTQLNNGNLASGSTDKTIKVWNVLTGKLIQDIKSNPCSVESMDLTENGYLLAGYDCVSDSIPTIQFFYF